MRGFFDGKTNGEDYGHGDTVLNYGLLWYCMDAKDWADCREWQWHPAELFDDVRDGVKVGNGIRTFSARQITVRLPK